MDKSIYQIYKISDWFNYVLNGDLIGWECACLNKKYVIKEAVKLLMKTDPLQLRITIDYQLKEYQLSSAFDFYRNWELVKNIKFAIQIIENHKIVNFKEAQSDYYTMLAFESNSYFYDYILCKYNDLKKMTDGMIKQEILKNLKNE